MNVAGESAANLATLLPVLDPVKLAFQLALAIGFGFLIGLQRERSRSRFGIRTFPLITVLGLLCATLASCFGLWVLPTGLFCLTLIGVAVSVSSQWAPKRNEPDLSSQGETEVVKPSFDFGTTTLITLLVMYCVGAMLVNPHWNLLALEITGITAIILQFKLELHQIADKLGESDMKAIMQFVMISFVILPLLPNKSYGPYGIFNPYETWLMVVLIVGVSLGGYIAYKFFGDRTGILLSGIFGGAISSMATTISYSRMTVSKEVSARISAMVIMIASTVLLVRLLVLSAIISEDFFYRSFAPVSVFMLCCLAPVIIFWPSIRNETFSVTEHSNPTQWQSALTFGLLYAVIAAAMKIASVRAGTDGLYTVAAISGLTDTTAVTLSTARLSLDNATILAGGWRVIIICSLTNMVFKWATTLFLSGAVLAAYVFRLFLFPTIAGILILLFWP